MSQINTLKITVIMLVVKLASISAFAVPNCAFDRSDIKDDLQAIASKLAVRYGVVPSEGLVPTTFKPNSSDLNKIYDGVEHRLDRSLPFLSQFNSVGIVSSAEVEQMQSQQKKYGGATLVSSCHVLISRHLIPKDSSGKYDTFSMLNISIGQNSCDNPKEFSNQNMKGKVIAMGESSNISDDWAIVKIPKVTNIKPSRMLANTSLTKANSLVQVGFPAKEIGSDSIRFRYSRISFTKLDRHNIGGTFFTIDKRDNPASSGSALFILGKDSSGRPEAHLAGIHYGEGLSIDITTIIDKIQAQDAQSNSSVWEQIDNNHCD